MPTENEIMEKMHIATLEILEATLAMNNTALRIQMRKFDEAKVGLEEIKGMIDTVIQTIPKVTP